ncbi:transcriptional regulator GcvA [Aromatoleum toluclasticum]|uniref:transcriptional regulator GcvA n=1 Tax=Aromatoleum toluclasticum TaxID=92003 RepID=UPI001D18E86F|nr:transcriptional regulator GcvA [Aromatoleum toluclasticum]MCC4117006.1 transcriptional regulator GcvA [Aromatoleum toluclasticum]
MERPGKLPPLPALRVFEAAARLSSVSRAAEELFVTHGAVSHQIRTLEEHLGFPLFHRQGRAVVLTPAGEELLQASNGALRQIADTVANLKRRSNPNRLSISVMPSFASRWLTPRIGDFIDAHPSAEVHITATSALADFNRDGMDLSIRWGPGGYNGVRSELLMDDVLFPVVSPALCAGHFLRTPADLAGLPLLRSEGEDWAPWFRAAGLDWPEPASGLMLSDSALVLQAALEGRGVALARRSLAASAVRAAKLLRPFDIEIEARHAPEGLSAIDFPPDLPFEQRPLWRYWIVSPERTPETPLLSAFLEWLRAEAAADLAAPLEALPVGRGSFAVLR